MNNGQFVWTVDGIVTVLEVGAVLIVSLLLGLVVASASIAAWMERRSERTKGGVT